MKSGYQTDAEFVCPICTRRSVSSVAVPTPGVFGQKSLEAEGDVEVQCMHCDVELSAYAYVGPFYCRIELTDHPATQVAANVPIYLEDEGWEDFDPPENPYSIFADSDRQLVELLFDQGSSIDGSNLINRLVFAHYIAAMEAFLADTLLNAVEASEETFSRLIDTADLNREKFTLSDIAKKPDLVKASVRKYIRDIQWHNLAKADALYKVVLQIDLFGILGDRKELLFRAVQQRHDCVHRNGFDVDGNRLDAFTEEYIKRVAEAVRFLVGTVEGHVSFGSVTLPA